MAQTRCGIHGAVVAHKRCADCDTERFGYSFRFNGAHTVNVHDADDNNIDCFSVGDFSRNSATTGDYLRGVSAWLKAHDLT